MPMFLRSLFCIAVILLFACGTQVNESSNRILRIGTMDTPETLDPHRRNALGSLNLVGQMYEPLVVYDRNLNLKPGLAESWENPAEHQWRFHLRRNVVFHTGKKMDAYDVAATFQRLRERSDLEISSYVSHISNVSIVDPYTIDLTTTRLSVPTLHRLLYVYIVPKNFQDFEGRWHKISAGTGPYKLKSANASNIVMERFDEYRDNTADFAKVQFRIFPQSSSIIKALEQNRLDVAKLDLPQIPPAVKDDYVLKSVESLYVVYLGFNMERKGWIFESRDERQKLDESLNRKRIVDEGASGYASITVQMIPPFVYGFDPSIRIPPFQKESAKFSNQSALKFLARTVHVRPAKAVKKQLEESGLRIDLQFLPDTEFFRQVRSGSYDLFISRWGCITADASELLDNQFYTKGKKDGMGLNNYTGFSSPEIDLAIEEASLINDPRARIDKLQKTVSEIDSQHPWIPLYISHDIYAVSREIEWQPRLDSRMIAIEMKRNTNLPQ